MTAPRVLQHNEQHVDNIARLLTFTLFTKHETHFMCMQDPENKSRTVRRYFIGAPSHAQVVRLCEKHKVALAPYHVYSISLRGCTRAWRP